MVIASSLTSSSTFKIHHKTTLSDVYVPANMLDSYLISTKVLLIMEEYHI